MRIRSVLSVAMVAATVACSPMLTPPPKPDASTSGANPDAAPQANVAAYVDPGPYAAGVMTVEIQPNRKAEIWYPASPSSTVGLTPDSYHIKDSLSTFMQSLLPAWVDPVTPTIAFRDVPSSPGGPFPLVLFSHGAVSYRLQSTFLTAHLATWGFVVISPDYVERGLPSLFGDPGVATSSDEYVAELAVEKMITLNTDPSTLQGKVDTSRLFPVGHSAGGSESTRLAGNRTDVQSWISLSAGFDPTRSILPAAMADPSKSALWMVGAGDNVASPSGVRTAFEYTAGPRKLVVIPGAGHNNAMSDICEIARDQGGLIGLAYTVGLPIPDFVANLGRDGCISPPNELSPVVWPIVRHFVTAELRYRSGLDAEPVGMGAGVVNQFGSVTPEYTHNP